MDEQHEELAALNALHALDEADQSALEIEMARDSELSGLAFELETAAATLAGDCRGAARAGAAGRIAGGPASARRAGWRPPQRRRRPARSRATTGPP